MTLTILILYFSAHYRHPVRIEMVTKSYSNMEPWDCRVLAEKTLSDQHFELPDDDKTADYLYTCKETARI